MKLLTATFIITTVLLLAILGCSPANTAPTTAQPPAPAIAPTPFTPPAVVPEAPISTTAQMIQDIPKFRAWALEHEPQLAYPHTTLQTAILLRHLVYVSVPFAVDGHILDDRKLATPFDTFSYIVNGGGSSYRCGGIHRIYQFMLAAFGIQSRYVGIFTDITPAGTGHAATDVLIDGIWIALDATLDASIRDNTSDTYLSWEQARAERGSIHWDNDGYQWPVDKIPDVWAPDFDKAMLDYMAIFPGPFDSGTAYLSPDSAWSGHLVLAWGTIQFDIEHVDIDPEMNAAFRDVLSLH